MVNREIIKSDLISLKPNEFYLKHIIKSNNWYFSEYLKTPPHQIIEKMDEFKEMVSFHLGINFHNMQIVGSAKVGYSLSPRKLLNPFHNSNSEEQSSDIDIAVVSDYLFHHFWREIRKTKGIQNQYYYNQLTKSIFRGYINEKDLMRINTISKEWSTLVSPLNIDLQDKLQFEHPITYRVYRSWEDLEDYQLISIKKAREKLEEAEGVKNVQV